MVNLNSMPAWFNRLLGGKTPKAVAPEPGEVPPLPAPVSPRVLLIRFDPLIPKNNKHLHDYFHWNETESLIDGFIRDLAEASSGYAQYRVVEQIVDEHFPPKIDGFSYSADDYVRAYTAKRGFHRPDTLDYQSIVNKYRILERIRSGEIDEVWWMGFPYAGFYESRMGGPGAFWCNAPALENSAQAGRRFIIMGFSCERGVGEMLESYGHRAESILTQVFRGKHGEQNLWARFNRYDQAHPGRAEVGSIHYAPNSRSDYDWGNPRPAPTRADTWLHYPNLAGEPVRADSRAWGSGDIREHHRWWLRHLPHVSGQMYGISNNWWEYIVDPNRVV